MAGEAAAPAAEDGAALELRSLRIHRVLGLLLNSSRRIRIGWPSRTQGVDGSLGAGERGREEGMALTSTPR